MYGLPAAEDFEREDIILGGCIVDELSPDVSCSNCDWSGLRWHVGVPLSPMVWIILDTEMLKVPIGLVAGRYDRIHEIFQFGHWQNMQFGQQFQSWLKSLCREPRCFTAPFDELSPGLIASLRTGRHSLDRDELHAAGFRERHLWPPKFIFDDFMHHLGN